MIHRQEDRTPKSYIRGERFFKLHDYWFFATREGASVGPFDSQEQAKSGVAYYVEFIQKAGPSVIQQLCQEPRYGT